MAFPTTAILDNFNRADAANLGANWSAFFQDDAIPVVSNKAEGPIAQTSYWGNYYNVATYANCEVYATLANIINPDFERNYFELYVRAGGSIATYPDGYIGRFTDGNFYIYRVTAGSRTVLGDVLTHTLSAGDSVGVEANGDTITIYWKPSGGSWGSVASRTDSTYTSGYLAVEMNGDSTNKFIFDDFGGGTIVAASAFRRDRSGIERGILRGVAL